MLTHCPNPHTVEQAPSKLGVLRTGLPTTLPTGTWALGQPFPGSPQGEDFPFNDDPGTPENEAASCQVFSDDNLNEIGSIRIEEFHYYVDGSGPCSVTPAKTTDKQKLVLGSVLGWQGKYSDKLINDTDLWYRPTNAGPVNWLKKWASDAWKYGAGSVVAPFKCLWDALFGDGCDFGSGYDLANKYNPVDYLDGWLPGFGDVRSDYYTGLWHFIDVAAGSGDYNDIRGMYYPGAGPKARFT